MKKQTRKLIASLVMLVLSIAMLGSATYAWFAMNADVNVGGMSVTAGTPTNLLIATSEDGDYSYTATFAEHTGNGQLLPMSTATPTDPNTFFALSSSASLSTDGGAADSGTYIVANKALSIGSNEDGYYIDYPIFLKTSAGSANATVYLSNLQIIDTQNTDLPNAIRVALIAPPDGDYGCFYGVDIKDVTTGVTAITSEEGLTKVTPTITGAGTYTYNETRGITVGSTPVELILRVWIEGQDSDCVNANAGANLTISATFRTYEAP